MAQKRKTQSRRKSSPKRYSKKQQGGFNFFKFTLGLLILVILGYAAIALYEGRLVPSSLQEFDLEMPEFNSDEEEQSPTEDNTDTPSTPKENNINEAPEAFDAEAFDLYFTKAFDFMWPAYSAEEAIIERPYYTLRYSEEHEQALWVAYALVADSLQQNKVPSEENYREDPRVRTGSARLSDYRGTGYVKGQLAPAADFSYDEFALSQSFYLSNISPQDPNFNRGIWRKLEAQVREWVMENDQVYVVTGPVLNKKYKTIGRNEVSVPEYYYKIVLDISKPEIKTIAFLMANQSTSAGLESFVVSIDEIEAMTQLDFFPSLPDELEVYLESMKQTAGWF